MPKRSWPARLLGLALGGGVLLTAAALALWPADDPRPDVVLVIGCTVRADQTSPWGGPEGITPTLERLATEGTRFERTLVHAPWTRPSVGSLVTGLYPAQAGLLDRSPGRTDRALPPTVTTLAELLHQEGWHTVGLTANPNLNRIFGFDQGFDQYTEFSGLWRKRMVKTPGAEVVATALEQVDAHDLRHRGQPLFLQLVLIDTHLPYQGTPHQAQAFEGPSQRVRTYRAMIAELDHSLGALLDGLEERGRGPDDLVFAFVGDHGEGLMWPQHHGNGHGRTLYPSAVHVPWVVRGPGVQAEGVVTGLSAAVDVLPTLLGTVGVQPPQGLPGQDLSAHLRGERSRVEREQVFSGTWFQGLDRAALYTEDRACLFDGDLEATRQEEAQRDRQGKTTPEHRQGCFSLADDPLGEQPARDSFGEAEVARARTRMLELAEVADTLEAHLDEEVDSQLRALGYVDDD